MNFSLLLNISSIVLGAVVGSFLNCLIYRLPRNISLTHPKRSFCPLCQRSLPWWENLPVLSWLFLRGRCAGCHAPISWRYPLIEIVTATFFWLCYVRLDFPMAFAAWIFVTLLVVATFIDLEHLMIPDEITLGGVVLGLGASLFLPELMGTSSRGMALLISFTSAAVGYFLLWGILELGKIAFGRKHLHWDQPHFFELLKKEGELLIHFEEEFIPLTEILNRSSDRIIATAAWLELAGEECSPQTFEISLQGIILTKRLYNLEEALPLRAEITKVTLPREAMGFGDVKFLACIGAFLGAPGMIFSLFAGSIIGAIAGCLMLLITRGRLGRCIPFGPYLALGALIWLLFKEAGGWRIPMLH